MHVAVIIPFRGDPETLRWTLDGFARQTLPEGTTMDVRICGDGVDVPNIPAPPKAGIAFRPMKIEHAGISAAKNAALKLAPADIVFLANADTRPDPDCVATHIKTLTSLPDRGSGAMVLGSAPYEPSPNPTVFDALKEETPMIFFFERLQPAHAYGFRFAWPLNLSLHYHDMQRLGFYDERFRPYGYEDLDFAWRLMGLQEKVFYQPAARVTHRHPMTFDDYLQREELLGIMTPVLHAANPDLFEQLHNTRDLAQLERQFRDWTRLDLPMHNFIYQRMHDWINLPAQTLGQNPTRQRLLLTLYQLHIPLKRLAFRLGFLHGLNLKDDPHWKSRHPAALWKKAITPQP